MGHYQVRTVKEALFRMRADNVTKRQAHGLFGLSPAALAWALSSYGIRLRDGRVSEKSWTL